jgi:hypothetical protein
MTGRLRILLDLIALKAIYSINLLLEKGKVSSLNT